MDIVATQGPLALFRGVVLRSVILGVGSCIFWPLQTTIATWLLLESHDVLGVVLEPPPSCSVKNPIKHKRGGVK
jgi:hypothetical protein